ncbi:hypothetical protein [Flavisericum labens]|uniref:hypothetical protein n=1 Tax=Flavisericum labens TaxID=3377112 RepID=UPI00387B1DB7
MRSKVYIVVLAVSFTLFNCEAANNCLRDLKPSELPNKELKLGYLGKNYYDELIPYIPKSPDTDVYVWDFEIEGSVPEGINVYLGLDKRIFEGVPKQTGIYDLKIFLDVDPIDGVHLCDSGRTSKLYTLQIK